MFRNHHRAKVIPRIDGTMDHARIDAMNEGFIVEYLANYEDNLISNLDHVARHADDSFDEVFLLIFRKPEHDHIAPLRIAKRNQCMRGITGHQRKTDPEFTVPRPLDSIG